MFWVTNCRADPSQVNHLPARRSCRRLKSHPPLRAVRIDTLSLAALEGKHSGSTGNLTTLSKALPVFGPHRTDVGEVPRRADATRRCASCIGLEDVTRCEERSLFGGGFSPSKDLESYAVSVSAPSYTCGCARSALRSTKIPIIWFSSGVTAS